MNHKLFILIFCFLFAVNADARPTISDLSDRQIKIHAKFTGKDLLLYGARVEAGDLIVVVRGPKSSYMVRKKERVAGAWVNTEWVEFDNVPQFYRILSSRNFQDIDAEVMKKNLELGFDQINMEVKESSSHENLLPYKAALRTKLRKDDLLDYKIGELPILEGTLFRTRIHFPKRISPGIYTAEVYSFDDGELKGIQSIPIEVKKVGFESFVSEAANTNPALYGVAAILIAGTMGWFAAGLLLRKV